MDRSRHFNSMDEYIRGLEPEVQAILEELRATIHTVAPEAEEKISYQIPTFYLKGNLVHFAAYKNHIGFYPTSSGVAAFLHELTPYHVSKGAIQFPIDQPLPLDLVRRIVKFRMEENLHRAESKNKKEKT